MPTEQSENPQCTCKVVPGTTILARSMDCPIHRPDDDVETMEIGDK